MSDPSLDRDIGRLEEHAKSTERRLEAIEKQLTDVLATLQHAKGGWRMLMIVGGGCAAIGALVTGIWSTITGKH